MTVRKNSVSVGETHEIDVPLKIGWLGVEVLQNPLVLPVEVLHRGGQKPLDSESPSLLGAERSTFVESGIVQQCLAAQSVRGSVRRWNLFSCDLSHEISWSSGKTDCSHNR
jgi:hypothetical protein